MEKYINTYIKGDIINQRKFNIVLKNGWVELLKAKKKDILKEIFQNNNQKVHIKEIKKKIIKEKLLDQAI